MAALKKKKKTSAKKAGTSSATRRAETTVLEYPGVGRRRNLMPPNWQPLVKAFGGVNALAKAIGVHYSTVNRWALHDSNVPEATRTLIRILSDQHGVKSPV
jgi:hypothetical protein